MIENTDCENCSKPWSPAAHNAEQWGVYHGRVREPWLCPSCIDDEGVCVRLGDVQQGKDEAKP